MVLLIKNLHEVGHTLCMTCYRSKDLCLSDTNVCVCVCVCLVLSVLYILYILRIVGMSAYFYVRLFLPNHILLINDILSKGIFASRVVGPPQGL